MDEIKLDSWASAFICSMMIVGLVSLIIIYVFTG